MAIDAPLRIDLPAVALIGERRGYVQREAGVSLVVPVRGEFTHWVKSMRG